MIILTLVVLILIGVLFSRSWRSQAQQQAEEEATRTSLQAAIQVTEDWPRPAGSHRTQWREKRKSV